MLYIPISNDEFTPATEFKDYNEIFEHLGKMIASPDALCPCCHKYYRLSGSDDLCPICLWKSDLEEELTPNIKGDSNRLSLNDERKRFNRKGVELPHPFKSAFESLTDSQIDSICNELNIDVNTLFGLSEWQLDCVYGILSSNEDLEYYDNGRHSERYKILSQIKKSFVEYFRNTFGNLWWDDDFSRYDAIIAHRFSNNHMKELKPEQKCGCFYCLEIFSSSEIDDWIIYPNRCDRLGTATCPKCGIDSVIGESSGYPITPEFLNAMNKEWFN